MNSQNIVDLIEQLSSLKQIALQTFSTTKLQSISNIPDCNLCFSLKNRITEVEEHYETISNEYNRLLRQTHKLIDMYYQLFQQEQRNYQQIILELKRDFQESEEKVKQLQSALSENKKATIQYTTLLLQKDQDLRLLEDKYDKQIRQKNNSTNLQQWQVLKFHRREKSQMYSNLQKQNIILYTENERYREENLSLIDQISQLKENIRRMQEDLVSNNIKSPKIINNIHDLGDFISNLGDRTFEDVENSIQRIQLSQQTLHDDLLDQQSYLTSSFAHKPMPLRQILNISGQSSKYFELLSKQKILNSNAGRRKQFGSNNKLNQNNLNSMNIINEDSIGIDKKMDEIKQFQVIDNEAKVLTYENLSTQTIEKNYVAQGTQTIYYSCRTENTQTTQSIYKNESVQTTEQPEGGIKKSMLSLIDPYHAFFNLSIQCLKLNWRNLDEVANMDLSSEWQKLVDNKVPFNKWNTYLIKQMERRVVK